MLVKHYVPIFLCMKKKFSLGNCNFNLTFDPVTWKSIRFLCYTRWMCGQTLRKVRQGVLELLIRNKKVTDIPTEWPTNMCKAIYPLFFEGGHNNNQNIYLYPYQWLWNGRQCPKSN